VAVERDAVQVGIAHAQRALRADERRAARAVGHEPRADLHAAAVGQAQRDCRGAPALEDHRLGHRLVARVDPGLERGVPEDLVEVGAAHLIGVVRDPAARVRKVRVLGLRAVRKAEVGAVLLHEARLLEALHEAEPAPERHRARQEALADGEPRVPHALDEQHRVARAMHELRKGRSGGAAADHDHVVPLAKVLCHRAAF
jgi:hypothetical protein